MTTALEGGDVLASHPARSLPPGKTRYPLCRRLSGSKGRSGQVRKISPLPGFDPRTLQPVASRYTDYATWPTGEHVQWLCLDCVMSFGVVKGIQWSSVPHYIIFPTHFQGKAYWINLLVHSVRSLLWIRYRIVFPLLYCNRILTQQDTEVKRPYCVV
jgi:hypothetical protein